MISLKRIFCTCCLLLSVWAVFAQGPSEWKALEKPLNFYLANDLGRNGYYDQKPIETYRRIDGADGRECRY